jgi:hypothetical protein
LTLPYWKQTTSILTLCVKPAHVRNLAVTTTAIVSTRKYGTSTGQEASALSIATAQFGDPLTTDNRQVRLKLELYGESATVAVSAGLENNRNRNIHSETVSWSVYSIPMTD